MRRHTEFAWDVAHNFTDLIVHREFLREELFQLSRPRLPELPGDEFIAVNLRLGNDFVSSESGLHGYRKNPASFWSPALQKVRLETGIEKAIMISDGSEHQIRRMFVEEGETMEIAQNRNAIQDLWILSNSTAMIGVGNSSFSAWGAFLSNAILFGSEHSTFDSYGLSCNYL